MSKVLQNANVEMRAYQESIKVFRDCKGNEKFTPEEIIKLSALYLSLEDGAFRTNQVAVESVNDDYEKSGADEKTKKEYVRIIQELEEIAKECLAMQTEAHGILYGKRNPNGLLRVYRAGAASQAWHLAFEAGEWPMLGFYECLQDKEKSDYESFENREEILFKEWVRNLRNST